MRASIDPVADEARLRMWLDSLPEVVTALTAAVGPFPEFIENELVSVWEWFLPYCVPGPWYQDPSPVDPMDRQAGFPVWVTSPARVIERRAFSIETLSGIDMVARFYAEVLLRKNPAAKAEIFDLPKEPTDDDGDIVLRAVRADGTPTSAIVFPHRDVVVQAQRAVFHGGYAPDQMARINAMRSKRLSEAH